MQIMQIEHVQLAMPAGGEQLARRFYGDLLGIPEVAKPVNLAKRGGCRFERGNLKLHLGVDPDFRPLQGYHRIYVDDPFGNRIELMESETT